MLIKNIAFPILAIDYGTKNTGFAIATDHTCALYIQESTTGDKQDILDIIAKYKPATLLFGLPINTQNKKQSDKVKSLAGYIKSKTNLPVLFQDERFSSQIADSILSNISFASTISNKHNLNKPSQKERNNDNDQVAAFVILDIFLQTHFK
ncbi:MAG: RuvX/YqgF family protein [Rickettsiales bacterium]